MIEVQFSQKTRSTVQQWQHSTSGDHWWLCSRPGSGSRWWQEYFTNSSRVKKSVPEWSGDHAPLVAGDHAPLVGTGQGVDHVSCVTCTAAAAAQLTSNNAANNCYHGATLHIFVQQTLAAGLTIIFLLFFLQSLVSFVLYLLNVETISTKARMQDGLISCCLKKMLKCSSECGVIM